MDRKINEIRENIQNSGFNGAVQIEYDSQIIFSEGFGKANFEHQVSNTPDTRFRIASITKQFTAAAILQLYERGELKLEDSIDKYIADYPRGNEIQIHHLLTHTSGISNFELDYDFYEVLHADSVLSALIDLFKYEPLNFDPGTQFSYSISGFLLLGYIIEAISHMEYEDYLQQNIFNKLNMKNTGFDHYRSIIINRANGYDMEEGNIRNAEFIDMKIAGAGGGLYSTMGDLHLFNQALKAGKIINPDSVEMMFSNQFQIAEGVSAGYGIFIESSRFHGKDRLKEYHSGGGMGVRSLNAYLPEYKLGFTVISNVNDRKTFSTVTEEMEAILLR